MKVQMNLRRFMISIHALRGEGDHSRPLRAVRHRIFQSTPSVGRATTLSDPQNMPVKFQSTPSVGRATRYNVIGMGCTNISIHALRGEGDRGGLFFFLSSLYFNPRPPWGGRPQAVAIGSVSKGISIHALRGEGDREYFRLYLIKSYFNPRPPWGGRRWFFHVFLHLQYFNPRPPWGGRR